MVIHGHINLHIKLYCTCSQTATGMATELHGTIEYRIEVPSKVQPRD